MPRSRFRLRTLMVAVAVIAAAFPAGKEAKRLIRLSQRYRRDAVLNARNAATLRAVAARQEALGRAAKDEASSRAYRESAAVHARYAESFVRLSRSYQQLAWRPWRKPPSSRSR